MGCAELDLELAEVLGVDRNRIAVAGDSAGGNLAAVLARRARGDGGPALVLQVLICPVIDARLGTTSWITYAKGPVLSLAAAQNSWARYATSAEDRANPDAAPDRAQDLTKLAPAFVITAEHDPLRDEGEAYAAALVEAGVQTTLTRYPGMVHGFVQMAGMIDTGRQAIADVSIALKSAFESGAP